MDDDEFDWQSDLLRQVPFMEPPADGIGVVAATALEVEKFFLYGVSLCLDSLLYTFTFLPLNAMTSLGTLCVCRPLYPRHVFALCQGAILVIVCSLLEVFRLDNLENTGSRIADQQSWTRLHTLFFLFAALDELMERIGLRVTGHLAWCVQNRQYRLPMFCIMVIYVFAHATILTLQVSTLHAVMRNIPDLIGFLLLVKLTAGDLRKAIELGSAETHELLTQCRQDIVQRFKWMLFLGMIVLYESTLGGGFDPHDAFAVGLSYAAVMTVDLVKHGLSTLLSDHAVTPDTYKRLRQDLSAAFLHIPKLGISDSSYKNVFAQQFQFVALPLGCVLTREGVSALRKLSLLNTPVTVLAAFVFLFAAKILTRLGLRSYAKIVHLDHAGAIHKDSCVYGTLRPPGRPPHVRKPSVSIFALMKKSVVGGKQASPLPKIYEAANPRRSNSHGGGDTHGTAAAAAAVEDDDDDGDGGSAKKNK